MLKRLFALCLLLSLGCVAPSRGYAKTIIPAIPESEARYDRFDVTLDGESAPVWRCRVSAMPFNRVWPGYQRGLDQTEEAGFTIWETDRETTQVVVKYRGEKAIESVVVRPSSLGISPEIDRERGEVRFALPGLTPCVVEINGFHNALHILPFPVYERPEGEVKNLRYYGPGVHREGVINVRSGDRIFVDSGAVVYGGFRCENVEDVKIWGPGIVDAGPYERGEIGGIFRVVNCKNIEIDGIVQRDTDVWSTTLYCCDDVTIRNTKLVGLWRYNADGIDVCNSERVLVENSFLRTFDDGLVVKGVVEKDKPTRDLTFRKNVVWCDWGRAMEIGAETRAPEIRDIRFEDSDIIRTTHIAMDIQHGDRAAISNVVFDDIRVEIDDVVPPPIYQFTDDQKYDANSNPQFCPDLVVIEIVKTPYSQDPENGTVTGVLFKDVRVLSARVPTIRLRGLDEAHLVKDVRIENLFFGDRRVEKIEELQLERNPFARDFSLK